MEKVPSSIVRFTAITMSVFLVIGITIVTASNAQNPIREQSEPVFLFVPTSLADTTAPIIEFIYPDFSQSDTVSVGDAQIIISGRVTEESDSVSISIDFDRVPLNNRQFSREILLFPGPNAIDIEVVDSEGNSFQKVFVIIFDDTGSQGRSP